ncbi:methyltransferase, putative, TIGR00027 family [Mycolicibacterium chubuense NBB4]|uniref:S-adenosyl-L-methionine-dependent methyltransferase n=1 Tax=Mycolicibacterium chubuense (strain NBB4) TaxID=710421 RepID=I4BMX7_MYCCN|nr:SAM-dependent methyltransferase [Mycolicibacterium chubuense]AFM18634.1 methyltransferase, putative, TIGR00027 family [Mycolicibacterium chubuense NBB4]
MADQPHDGHVPAPVQRKAVADTGVLVAAIRAHESTRDDRLFTDPYAARLAGTAGLAMLERMVADVGERSTTQIVVRTRFWDEALLRATGTVRQVVILAAGLDARAYRLAWPAGTTVFEIDQPAVIAAKAELLAGERPRCVRVAVGVDLADAWAGVLTSAGFDPARPTVWLIEGLLQYLDEAAVHALFAQVDALSAAGSVLLYDIVGKALMEAPFMATLLRSMAEQGSPWLFATDAPGELAAVHGWSSRVTDVAEPGHAWGRSSAPAAPLDAAGVPRGYFVEAVKPGAEPAIAGSSHTSWPG